MKYIAAFDGGGTKTRCIIGDEQGNILADCCMGATNHQLIGLLQAETVLRELFEKSLHNASLTAGDISMAYLGMSGADMESDFDLLNGMCSKVFGELPFKVVNDTWIAMRSGLKNKWGAVAICGTGANSAVMHPDGRKLILRALSYTLGGYGGGNELAAMALHHAFRSDEGTGEYTLLEKHLPEILGAGNMEELLHLLYPESKLEPDAFGRIVPLIFQLANEGDHICQKLLADMGSTMGEILAGLIKRMHMEDMELPVVIGGNVFKGSSPILLDEFRCALHRTAPRAYLVCSKLPPVAGAFLSGLDYLGLLCSNELYSKLEKFFAFD